MDVADKKIFQREILFSFWKIHILRHAGQHPVYGQWMLKELRRHGYDVSPGSLYPIFHRMQRFGWLEAVENTPDNNTSRQLYILTDKGKEILNAATAMITEVKGDTKNKKSST